MSNTSARGKGLIMFALGTIACLASLFLCPEWVWVPLPFALTGLTLIFDGI